MQSIEVGKRILINFWILFLSKYSLKCAAQNSFFRLEKQNSTIVIVEPFNENNFQDKTRCFMHCLEHRNECCLAQIQETQKTGFLCRLFQSLSLSHSSSYSSKTNSEIFSVVNNPDACSIPAQSDCLEHYKRGYKKDGVYPIIVNRKVRKVYCDMKTNGGGGWTVIQSRFDGSVSFDRSWEEYKNGFGDVNGEYWLGNEAIHYLTLSRDVQIRIKARTFGTDIEDMTHKDFWIEEESENYRLNAGQFVSSKSGKIYTDWTFLNGMYFSTKDRDNDKAVGSCGEDYHSGWWFKKCFKMNFNGVYSHQANIESSKGITWFYWTSHRVSLRKTRMSIRRKL